MLSLPTHQCIASIKGLKCLTCQSTLVSASRPKSGHVTHIREKTSLRAGNTFPRQDRIHPLDETRSRTKSKICRRQLWGTAQHRSVQIRRLAALGIILRLGLAPVSSAKTSVSAGTMFVCSSKDLHNYCRIYQERCIP